MNLYRGYWPLFWRDVPGYAVYFATYDLLKKQLDLDQQTHSFKEIMMKFLCGGMSGVVGWFVIYPFDIINTKF